MPRYYNDTKLEAKCLTEIKLIAKMKRIDTYSCLKSLPRTWLTKFELLIYFPDGMPIGYSYYQKVPSQLNFVPNTFMIISMLHYYGMNASNASRMVKSIDSAWVKSGGYTIIGDILYCIFRLRIQIRCYTNIVLNIHMLHWSQPSTRTKSLADIRQAVSVSDSYE